MNPTTCAAKPRSACWLKHCCFLSIYQVLKHCGMYLIVSLLLFLRVLIRCTMYLPYKSQSQLLRKSLSRPTDAVGSLGWGPPGLCTLTTFLLTVKERHRSWWRKWQLGSARPRGIIVFNLHGNTH